MCLFSQSWPVRRRNTRVCSSLLRLWKASSLEKLRCFSSHLWWTAALACVIASFRDMYSSVWFTSFYIKFFSLFLALHLAVTRNPLQGDPGGNFATSSSSWRTFKKNWRLWLVSAWRTDLSIWKRSIFVVFVLGKDFTRLSKTVRASASVFHVEQVAPAEKACDVVESFGHYKKNLPPSPPPFFFHRSWLHQLLIHLCIVWHTLALGNVDLLCG